MRAAIIGVVERHHIAGLERGAPRTDDGAHTFPHGTQMHRHMRGVGNQRACRIENGTGKIKPFLEIYRKAGVLQHRACLFSDAHEQVVEEFEHHRIGAICRQDIRRTRTGRDAAQHQMIACGDFGLPARFHHGGGIGFAQQRRPRNAIPRAERIAIMHRRSIFGALGEQRDTINRHGPLTCLTRWQSGFAHFLTGRGDFRDTGFHNHLAFRRGKAKAPAMRFGEFRQHFLMRAESDGQESIGAGIAQMEPPRRLQTRRIGTLARKFPPPRRH